MTKTQKQLLTAGIITAIILFFSRKRSKAKNSDVANAVDDILNQGGGTRFSSLPNGVSQELFIDVDMDFENEIFHFITPAGSFTITQPNTSTAQYNSLHSDGEFQFGWQAPYPGKIVVTLMPMQQKPLVENIIIDLESETVEFEYVQL